MQFRNAALAAVLGVIVIAGAVVPSGAAHTDPVEEGSLGVVGLIDTGINPYHMTFRDSSDRAYTHPSTYIPGYPEDAEALHISLDTSNYQTAVKRDCTTVWKKVRPGKLYWFPGTKIVAAISFSNSGAINCSTGTPSGTLILDAGGHGTMVASRAASSEYGACRSCLIGAIQGFTTDSVTWAASQAHWLDVQSNSWGPVAPAWDPTGASGSYTNNPAFVRAVEAAARKQVSFWASGNGVATRGGVLGHPTVVDPRMTPSIVMVGGHDSGYINTWPDFPPHVISDSCDSWAAGHVSVTRSAENIGGGTSGASPYAAGGAVRLLLEARRLLGDEGTGVDEGVVARGPAGLVAQGPLADGQLTMAEWRDVLLKTATARPKRQHEDGSVCGVVEGLVLYTSTPVQCKDVPAGYPEFLHIGYGAVDDEAFALARDVLHGRAPLPTRTSTDTYFAADGPVRSALHDVYDG